MTPKYTPCKNCGANEYEIKSLNTLECEYCGTEYVIEVPERQEVEHTMIPIMMSTCFTGTVAIESVFADNAYYKRRYGL